MARAGETVEHPLAGTRIVFLRTAHDTDGELLELDVYMRGGRRVPAEHVHPYQEEKFEVLSGTARFRVRGQERGVGVGEKVVIPAGTPHVWGNPGEEEAHLIAELRPALDLETWFETFFGLAKDGKVNPKSGLPNSLQWAVISREFKDAFRPAQPPLLVQKILYRLLAPIGELLGYKARYPEYSGPEEPKEGRASEGLSMGILAGIVVAVLTLLLLGRRVRPGRR